MNEKYQIDICYWQTQAYYETETLGVDRKHWKECLVCDGKRPTTLEHKPNFRSVTELSELEEKLK